MNQKSTKWLVSFIALTIAITIIIQLFWNYENYKTNKQRYQNDVQIALDNSVDAYFAEISKTDLITILDVDQDSTYSTERAINFTKNMPHLEIAVTSENENSDSIELGILSGFKDDVKFPKMKIIKGKQALDSIGDLQKFLNKMSFSITRDSIDLKVFDSILIKELARKNLLIQHKLNEIRNDTIIHSFPKNNLIFTLNAASKSTLFKPEQKLFLHFEDSTLTILKKGLTSIILSLVLSILIITCLIYLLHIINTQKQLAEIKNDLISNITHEFKTPIATTTSALEGIKNFNDTNDSKKTNEYLDISNQQLRKLNVMVEKLLETATLDSDKLVIQKEEIEVISFLKNIVTKYKLFSREKVIQFTSNMEETIINLDPFHFENVVGNLIDNALKYGGDKIEISLYKKINSLEIIISDDGVGISKNQSEKIFDKFYRIPTGNRHDVKGFGIGLYYSKKIIEKHGGKLELISKPKMTIFKITL